MRILNVQVSPMVKFLLICIISMPLIFSCQPPQESETNDGDARENMLKHLIAVDNAVDLYKAYGNERIEPLADSLKSKHGDDFNDTRLVSLDFATIKAYIKYVEESSEALKVKPEGLHFYFGVYADGEEGDNQNHQTFFIAPSTSKDNVQSGYTITSPDGKDQIVYLKDFLNTPSESNQAAKMDKASFLNLLVRDGDGLILNKGQGTPPNGSN